MRRAVSRRRSGSESRSNMVRGDVDIDSCNIAVPTVDYRTNTVDLLHGKSCNNRANFAPLRRYQYAVKTVLVCIFVSFSTVHGYGQQIAHLLQAPNAVFGKGIEFGVNKINNTFVWIGNVDVDISTAMGDFRLVNQYRSSAFRTSTLATRDDETQQLSWLYRLTPALSAIGRQGWLLSRDSRSVVLNSLERLDLVAGLRYQPGPEGSIEAIAGIETLSQVGVRATGPLAGLTGRLTDVNVDQWLVSGTGLVDWQQLDAQRTNSDLDLRVTVVRSLADGSSLRLSIESVNLAREFFTVVDPTQPLNVEQRTEQRLVVGADVSYAVLPTVTLGIISGLQTNGVNRGYATGLLTVPLTSVERQLKELVIDVEGYAQVRLPVLTLIAGGSVFQRSELNGVANTHNLNRADVETIRLQEYQRDNETFRTRMFTRGAWNPSSVDTVRIDVSGWLLRYNTPSQSNDDDRDELATMATITYARRFSPILSMSLGLSGQYLHLVFLKSSRSALNNVNRVLRLSPSFQINGSVVRMQPQMEILANYTVYDFEGAESPIQSFSFRQISYRDSLWIKLTEVIHAESQILLRYFERSTLQWSSFSETPQTGNLEYLVNLLIFSTPSPVWKVGAGLRLYTLDQRSILAGAPSNSIGVVRSVGPEVAIRYIAPGGSILTLNGWYEFQQINVTQRRELPNILLSAIVRL